MKAMLKITSQTIWDLHRLNDPETMRMELTHLARHKGYWYCGFHEGVLHWNHPGGRARIIRSADGVQWESVLLLKWSGGDVREPRLSVTAEGRLLINTSVFYVSDKPRPRPHALAGKSDIPPETALRFANSYFQLEEPGTVTYRHEESQAARQSMNWISCDGVNWESAFACPTGLNTWRWDVTWYNGMGYSIGYSSQWGPDRNCTLYRTRDGKNWRILKENFYPDGKGSEGGLSFGKDGTAYCLLRKSGERAVLGIGTGPYYQDWKWKSLSVDWNGDGQAAPAAEVFRVDVGGPLLLHLSDGRLLAAGRALGPGQDDGRVGLFWVDTESGTLTRFAEIDGTSYPGVVEHEGQLWVTSVRDDIHGILLGKVDIPPLQAQPLRPQSDREAGYHRLKS